ncbi:hypothetical protein SAMN04487901_10639 [Prevotella communis]|uniref:Uncharacterized protein n=1 Tax=Prevotella communis TaxID=2913614 RepID=A0A1G7VMS1_9BACT|nr:hypothetical protein [Prevotella communis]SDG60871.1 hypothetical protein SAMN04487901_10639 [Prevotella communis]
MKKTYISPETIQVNVEVQKLMVNSFTKDASGDVTQGELIDENADEPGLSRQSLWDDEE